MAAKISRKIIPRAKERTEQRAARQTQQANLAVEEEIDDVLENMDVSKNRGF